METTLITKFDPGDFGDFTFDLPSLKFPYIQGTYFELETNVKLIVDIPYSSDINVPIEFYYYLNPPENASLPEKAQVEKDSPPTADETQVLTCGSCGVSNPIDSIFCEECGNRF